MVQEKSNPLSLGEQYVTAQINYMADTAFLNLVETSITAQKKNISAAEVLKLMKEKIDASDLISKWGLQFANVFTATELIELTTSVNSPTARKSLQQTPLFSQFFFACKQVADAILDSFPSEVIENEESSDFVISCTDAIFEKEALQAKLPVVVKAYGPICPPCKVLSPIFAALAKQLHEKVKFIQFDAQKEAKTAQRLEIGSLPTLVFIKGGKILKKSIGVIERDAILIAMLEAFA